MKQHQPKSRLFGLWKEIFVSVICVIHDGSNLVAYFGGCFFVRYAATEVKAYYDWRHKGIVVRGQDLSGNWANPAVPQ